MIDELKDLLSAEQQLIEALPDMADAATQRQLKAAFKSHLAQTRGHEKRVSQALRQLKEKPDSKTCEAMEGLLEEGQELMSNGEPGALLDAMLITAAQKVEHYEIATYGTVRTYAQVLGERGVARLLDQTLREEKAADKKLTGIAEGSINKRAAREWHEQQTAAGMLQKGAEWVGATVGGALKRVRTQASDRSSSNGRKGRTTASRRRAARKSSGSRGRSRSRARTR